VIGLEIPNSLNLLGKLSHQLSEGISKVRNIRYNSALSIATIQ